MMQTNMINDEYPKKVGMHYDEKVGRWLCACHDVSCFDGTFMKKYRYDEGIRLRSGMVLPIAESEESNSDSDSDVSYIHDISVVSDVWSDDSCVGDCPSEESETETTIEETTEKKVETTHYESDSETETTETKVMTKTKTNFY